MKKVVDDNSTTLLIVERGEELLQVLGEYAVEAKLTAAWLSGLGGAAQLTLGFYDSVTKEYVWKVYDEPLEILSLTGNMAVVDGQPFWHIHGVFSGRDFAAIGGHVKELVIGLTGEVHITKHQQSLTRVFDDATGLKLIDCT